MPRSRWLIFAILCIALLCLYIPFRAQQIIRATAASAALPGDSLPPQVARSQFVGQANPQQSLSLSINLTLNHLSELRQYISALYTPGSYLYHHYLRPTEFAADFGPTVQDIRQVTGFLQAQGFTVIHAVAGQQVIDFSGSVAQAESAFGVQINRYRASNGRIFYANSSLPRVPLALRPLIANISGLNNVLQRQHPSLQPQRVSNCGGASRCDHSSGNSPSSVSNPQTISCPGSGSSVLHYYTPAQFATAYNFSGFYNAGYHGEGQSVALFELDSYAASDISSYQSCFDRNSPTRIKTTLIDGGPGSPGMGGLEVDIDMEVVLGMLPDLANLFVYEAPNTDSGYNDEWMQILSDDIPIVSTAWGLCEPDLSGTDITAEQQFFMQAVAQGQSLLAASGDYGAYDCGDSTLAVDDPASNPYVTGVGGTHLAINSNNTYNSESGWSGTPASNNGSGGGISQLWSMPSYQSGLGVINSKSSASPCHAASGQYCREVPDVALNADTNTGYIIYCTITAANCPSSNQFVIVGGTSATAPMWAAVTALTNQYALAHGGNNLGFLNPVIYTLLNNSSLYKSAFHDVTSGSNLYYPATAGYDMVTGVGTYNAYAFAVAAVSLPGSRNVPASTHWYFAEGHAGNNFQEYLTLENPSVSSSAHVTVNYLLRGKPPMSSSLVLNPSTRNTVNVNNVLAVSRTSTAGMDVSLSITSDIPIVAERPIYFTFLSNTSGGSDIIGMTQPAQHFTFANGETLPGYYTFLTVLNPLGQPQATVTATYYSGGAMIGQSTVTVPPGQRNTILANAAITSGKQFLIQVDANQPVVVERPMYFRTTVTGISGTVAGGSSLPGISPATSWYFPDGSTGGQGTSSQENLILANPDANGTGTPASVSITYALANGTTKMVNVSVPAKSQLVENVNTDVGSGTRVAMKVLSTNGISIVAERQQFFSSPALVPTPTGVEVVGVAAGTGNLPSVYSFAEGHLGNSFSEFITLFNPNTSTVTVALTYFVTHGPTQVLSQQQVSIPAMGVVQANANTFLNVPASPQSGAAADVALVVQALPGSGGSGSVLPIVAERSLYFNFQGSLPGETSVVGYSGA